MKQNKNIDNYILTGLFILMLILPNLVLIANIYNQTTPRIQSEINNNRSALRTLKDYYSENFGTKTALANTYLNVKLSMLNETPLPYQVVLGKEGWCFLGNDYQNTLTETFGNTDITFSMFNTILEKLNETNNYLKEKQINFYVVIAPNKNTIYKEYLPYQFNQSKTALQLLENYLAKKYPSIKFINLTNTLLNNKHNNLLYYKTDSHWNDLGAFYGYNTIMAEINKDIDVNIVSLKD